MKLSIAMIVKNEEKNLEKSLKEICKYDFDIVIVDTGSTDKTKEVALKYTKNVFEYKWCNDFAKARNFSISKAKGDYILVIDADEVIESIDINNLKTLINKNNNKVGRILRINQYSRNGERFTYKERVNRLFKKDKFKYSGRIHEQVTEINNKSYDTYNVPIVLNHYGYEKNEINRKNKIYRNINLLNDELKENGNDPYILYQLGKSYYMNEDYEKAIKSFSKAMDFDLDTKLEYVQDMIESYGYALINSKRYKESFNIINLYNEFNKSCDFVFLCGLIYMNNGMFNEAVDEFLKTLKFKECKMEGVNSYLSNYNIGVIYECLGNFNKAYKYYKKSIEYKKSKERLKVLSDKNDGIKRKLF